MSAEHSPAIERTETENIAAFALGLTLEAIPQDVVTLAKEHLLDVLGIALASSKFEFGQRISDAGRAMGSGNDATTIGSGDRLPAASAALVNGTLAHCLDFDDTHVGAIYHASAPAMASAFAAGQASRSSGREVLTAFIVALEVGCRLGTFGAGKIHTRGFHPTAICGTFAAAAAAGRLYRLEEQSLVWALGLCGSMAAGVLEVGESWLKRLHPGWSAHSGVSAVILGRAGFLGPRTMLEGRHGFFSTHINEVPTPENSPSRAFSVEWQTRGIALKPYPCCHFIHAFVDAALSLREQFDLNDIARIECPLTPMLMPMVGAPRERCVQPPTVYAALFSVHYAVAVALVRGRVDVAGFYDEPLNAPDVLRIADLVHCVDDPHSDFPKRFPGEVIVTLKDGRVIRERRAASLGSPDVPLPRDAIVAKFMANATRVISAEQAKALADAVFSLERADSLDALMALCVAR